MSSSGWHPFADDDAASLAWEVSAPIWEVFAVLRRTEPISHDATTRMLESLPIIVLDMTTSPSNPEIDACLKQTLTQQLQNFGAGVWNLRAKRTRKAQSRMFDEQLEVYLRGYGQEHAHACYPKQNAPKTLEITGSAKPNDKEFTLTLAGGDEAFRTCVRDKIQASLRDSFEVFRKLEGGKSERYFRIDATVKAKVTVEVKSPARIEAEEKAREEERRRRNPYE